MEKEIFNKIVTAGDLILVTTKESGKHIDRFNRNIIGTGIFRANSDESFYLCSIAEYRDNSINTLDINHTHLYDTIKSVVVLRLARDLKTLAQKLKNE